MTRTWTHDQRREAAAQREPTPAGKTLTPPGNMQTRTIKPHHHPAVVSVRRSHERPPCHGFTSSVTRYVNAPESAHNAALPASALYGSGDALGDHTG
ncbi:hypothetical protein E9Z77_002215 [Escherichia coli]|nr:hypothetical protein [Escherichia coli]